MYVSNFLGCAGVMTPSKLPPPYEKILPLPTPYFKMFLERSLNDPYHSISSIFYCYPSPSTNPFPPKNFDHTPYGMISSEKSRMHKVIAFGNNRLPREAKIIFYAPYINIKSHKVSASYSRAFSTVSKNMLGDIITPPPPLQIRSTIHHEITTTCNNTREYHIRTLLYPQNLD